MDTDAFDTALPARFQQLAAVGQGVGDAFDHQYHVFQLLALAAQVLGLFGVVPDIGVFGKAAYFFQTVFFTVVVKDTPGCQCCG